MENESERIATDAAAQVPRGMNRRELVRRLATAMAAGTAIAAVPAAAVAHPSGHPHGAMMNGPATEPAVQPEPAPWAPLFFDPHQNETFTLLAERMIPGSTGAGVSQFVDLLLSVDSLDVQKQFVNSLSAFDAYSLENDQRPFKNLAEDEQNHVLTVASTMKPGGDLHRFEREHILGPGSEAANQGETLTLRDHFENLKHWIREAYFSSEPGMKSMGWTGQVYFSSFPNCNQSEGSA